MANKVVRRENFDVSPEQQANIEALQAILNTNSKKDALLIAVELTLHLASASRKGNHFFIGHPGKALQRFIMLGIEKPDTTGWKYLVEHAHPWKKQLFVKGRKLPAAVVWSGMTANKLTVEEAADNWDLAKEVIEEIVLYCESNRLLIQMEADEEARLLREKGIEVGRPTAFG